MSFEGVGSGGGESGDLNVATAGHDEARWEFFLEFVEGGLEGHAVEVAAPAAALPAAHFVGDGGWAGVGGDENEGAGAVHEAEERSNFEKWVNIMGHSTSRSY